MSRCMLLLLLVLTTLLPAQERLPSRERLERVYAVVPLIGAGTFQDPKRPLFAPKPGDRPASGQPQILGYFWEVSDDGRSAIVEFWSHDRKAFSEILNASRPDVKAFERGRATKEEIESEFKKHKRDFDPDKFAARNVPAAPAAGGSK